MRGSGEQASAWAMGKLKPRGRGSTGASVVAACGRSRGRCRLRRVSTTVCADGWCTGLRKRDEAMAAPGSRIRRSSEKGSRGLRRRARDGEPGAYDGTLGATWAGADVDAGESQE